MIDKSDLSRLRASHVGSMLIPGDARYEQMHKSSTWNGDISHRPAVIVQPVVVLERVGLPPGSV